MKSRNKYQAFTILEVLVVLVITALVIYLGFLLLSSNRNQLFIFSRHYQEKQDLQFCQYHIKEQFYQADQIMVDGDSFLFQGNNPHRLEISDSIVQFESLLTGEVSRYPIKVIKTETELQENLVSKLKMNIWLNEKQSVNWYFEKYYNLETLYEQSLK